MVRNLYDRELANLNQQLNDMGAQVEEAMEKAMAALRRRDVALAREVAANDDAINAMESRIEQLCMGLIIRQQPIAGDLRNITATLKVITDMERIADQCADICEIIVHLVDAPQVAACTIIAEMFEQARSMFVRALDCHIRRDEQMARQVCSDDDKVDAGFRRVVLELVSMIKENPGMAYFAMDLAFIAKYIERIGDHATNIAEWAIFVVTGTHADLNQHSLPG